MLWMPFAGTWGQERSKQRSAVDPLDWFVSGSGFNNMMVESGHERHDQNDDRLKRDPGYWSGDIAFMMLQRFSPWHDHLAAAKAALPIVVAECLEVARRGVLNLLAVTHSHAGNILAYCLPSVSVELSRADLRMHIHVLDIDMPVKRRFVRRGMYAEALRNVEQWQHCYSGRGWGSKFRWLGNAFGPRRLPGAGNIEIPGGHSGVLDAGQPHILTIPRILETMHLP